MEKENYFPLPEEIKLVLNDLILADEIKNIAASNGIFIDYGIQSDYADLLSKIYWDFSTICRIHDMALFKTRKGAISGFWINIENNEDNLNKVDFSILKLINEKVGQEIGERKIKLTNPKVLDNEGTFEGSIEYKQKKVGKTKFIDEVDRSFSFICSKKDDNQYEFLVENDSSNDKNVLEDFIKRQIQKEPTLTCKTINLLPEKLGSYKLVEFFDTLAKQTMPDWEFKEIKKIIVRQRDMTSDEGNDHEVENQHVLGIQKAILEGTSLRTNSFVKECEINGYRFMAMTYSFRKKNKPFGIDISTEFKEKPKVFEVNVVDFFKIEGVEKREIDVHLDPEEKKSILGEFYRTSKSIYEKLIIGVPLNN